MAGTLHGKQIQNGTINWKALNLDPETVPRASDNTNALDRGYLGGSIYVKDMGSYSVICMVEPFPETPEPTGFQAVYGALLSGLTPGVSFTYDQVNDQNVVQVDELGSNVSIPFPDREQPVIWFYAEPVTEPVKTSWYVDSLNNEAIGTQTNREGTWLLADGTWVLTTGLPVRIYFTAFATEFSTVEFRV